MNKTLLILEDSSRAGFGGGQKMTLTVCDILKQYFKFRFIDFSDKSRFANIVKQQYKSSDFISLNQSSGNSNNRLLSWPISIFNFAININSGLSKIIGNEDVDNLVVYATSKRSLLYAYFLNKRFGIPFIYHAHMVEMSSFIISAIVTKLLSKASAVLCVSKTVMNSIKSDNKVLLYNPTLNSNGYKGEKQDNRHFVVAFVGSLIPIKGVEYFIDAAMKCSTNIEFRIYGEGPLRKQLETRASGKVKFMGFCNNIIDEQYNSIDIIVLPTIIQESLSLAVIDAKSCGIPVIVTSPGGQAEIVRDGIDGIHVPMKDSDAIAAAIMKISKDLNTYNSYSKASYESSNQFGYNEFKNKLINIFQNI